jgi:cytochrome c-type biogenesis protein CcmH
VTLWIILALMTVVASAGVSLPLVRNAPGRLPLAVGLAVLFGLCLGVLYPRLGRPDLTSPPANPGAATPAPPPDPELAKLVPQLQARMKASPGDPRGWRLLGWSYEHLGRFGDASDAYGRAVALEPGDWDDVSSQGEALTQAAGGLVTPGARSLFARALALNASDPRARYFLAMARDQDGDHAGAMADWITLIKSAPPDAPWVADVRTFVAKVAADRGVNLASQLPDAAPAGRNAMIQAMVERLAARLKAQPRDADGWIRLMRSRMVLGDVPAASKALGDGLSAFADSPTTQARLRAAAAAMGVPSA